MEFCVISPITGLKRFAALSKRHLVLAHLLHNQEYHDFYVGRRKAGDLLILDNGAYENTKPLDSAAYTNMVRRLDPQVVVLPDILMSPWRETTAASLKYLDVHGTYLHQLGYNTEFMFVPQTTRDDPNGWQKALHTVVNDGRVGHMVKWVGLGRYTATEFPHLNNANGNAFYNWRVGLAVMVKNSFPHLRIHALGMAAGDTNELISLQAAGVESIDSSAPVWRGWNEYTLHGLHNTPGVDLNWKEDGTPCNFFAPFPTHVDTEALIMSNLKEVGIVAHTSVR